MTVVGAIKEGFKLTNRNLKLFLVLFCVNLFLLGGYLLFFKDKTLYFLWRLIQIFLIAFISGGILSFLKISMAEYKIIWSEFTYYCKKYCKRLIGLSILFGIILLLLIIITKLNPRILGIVFAAFMLLVEIIIVLEDKGVFSAITDTIRFIRENFKRIGVLLIIFTGVYLLLELGFVFPLPTLLKPLLASKNLYISAATLYLPQLCIKAYLYLFVAASYMTLYLKLDER